MIARNLLIIVEAVALTVAVLAFFWLMSRWLGSPAIPERVSQQTPKPERDLLGEDYRDHVVGYFTERFITDTRKRMAVFSVTGADPFTPETNESRALAGADSPTRNGNSHASYK